jgi:hypothetical protein
MHISACLSVCLHVSTKESQDVFVVEVVLLEGTPNLYLEFPTICNKTVGDIECCEAEATLAPLHMWPEIMCDKKSETGIQISLSFSVSF